MQKKPVLAVVGLGVAGVKVAKKAHASGAFDVIAIDPKDFFEVPFAAVRSIVQGDNDAWLDRTLIPYASIPGGVGRLIKASVTAVTKQSLTLDTGEIVAFDLAVIATGSLHSGQGVVTPSVTTVAERKAQIKATSDKIAKATNIVVAGGGPVGLEIIGEIVDKYAGKSITLVHSGARLLEDQPEKLGKYINSYLALHKVKVEYNDKADKLDETTHTLTTKGGKTLPADVVIWAAGSRPVTQAFVAGKELSGSVDARGRIKVDPYLRLDGSDNIFVVGDINDTPQVKLGFLAGGQADLTVKNLAAALANKPLTKWAPPMKKGAIFVTLGKGDGVGHVNGCLCTGWAVKGIKGGDLFVGQTRKDLGLK